MTKTLLIIVSCYALAKKGKKKPRRSSAADIITEAMDEGFGPVTHFSIDPELKHAPRADRGVLAAAYKGIESGELSAVWICGNTVPQSAIYRKLMEEMPSHVHFANKADSGSDLRSYVRHAILFHRPSEFPQPKLLLDSTESCS